MNIAVVIGIMLPFFGTALGSAAVFLMKRNHRMALDDCLCGFAGGVMLAASVWSLLLPAIDQSKELGALSFLPSAAGFFLGVLFMLGWERLIRKLPEAENSGDQSALVSALAVTVHNFPEGMAVGLAFAALPFYADKASLMAALSLSLGIAIQNIPEGAIVSLPQLNGRVGKCRAFLRGVASGAVEPVGAILTLLFAGLFSPLMPFLLSFAAGAMIFVVMNELSSHFAAEKCKGRGMVFFALGFVIMMSLDVALG